MRTRISRGYIVSDIDLTIFAYPAVATTGFVYIGLVEYDDGQTITRNRAFNSEIFGRFRYFNNSAGSFAIYASKEFAIPRVFSKLACVVINDTATSINPLAFKLTVHYKEKLYEDLVQVANYFFMNQ